MCSIIALEKLRGFLPPFGHLKLQLMFIHAGYNLYVCGHCWLMNCKMGGVSSRGWTKVIIHISINAFCEYLHACCSHVDACVRAMIIYVGALLAYEC